MRPATPISLILAAVLLLTAALSCTMERPAADDLPLPAGERGAWRTVQLAFAAPQMAQVGLRAVDERQIMTLRAAVYRAGAGQTVGDATFAYEAKVVKMVPPTSFMAEVPGKLTLLVKETPAGSTDYFVLLANAGPDDLEIGAGTIAESLKKVVFPFDLHPKALPMFGVSSGAVVAFPTDNSANAVLDLFAGHPIPLICSVAKVSVGFNWMEDFSTTEGGKYEGSDEYEIEEIRYYNMSDKGFVAPHTSDIEFLSRASYYDPFDEDWTFLRDVPAASLPADNNQNEDGLFPEGEHILYVPEAINADKDAIHPLTDSLAFTQPEEHIEDYIKRPCIIVGLRRKNAPGTGKVYYRLDFIGTSGEGVTGTPDANVHGGKTEGFSPEESSDGSLRYNYVDIRRDVEYLFSITAINGDGYASAPDALKGPALNIRYNVEVWMEYGGSVDDSLRFIQSDGRFLIAAQQDHVLFPKDDLSQVALQVRTSKDEDLGVAKGADSYWLEADTTHLGDNRYSLALRPNTNNTTGASRTTEVVLTCRRLRLTITVTQEG